MHAWLGRPAHGGCAALPAGAACWVCAAPAPRGLARAAWLGAGFVGQNRVRAPASGVVCEACAYVCARLSPVPGRPPRPGRAVGGNYRNYSHLYAGGGYETASKAEKARVRAFLRRPKPGPWFAAVADSGQKHLLPWVPVNGTSVGGAVLFEEAVLRVPGPGGWALVEAVDGLLAAGATRGEILAGRYRPATWRRARPAVEGFEARHGGAGRGGHWFRLAVFLAAAPPAVGTAWKEGGRDAAAPGDEPEQRHELR